MQLQVIPNSVLTELAKRQYQKIEKRKPSRLTLLDRNSEELALTSPASSVFARPKLIPKKKKTARTLALILGGTYEDWYRRLRTKKPFVWIRRQVSKEVAERLAKQKLPGIYVESENKRIYPNGELASAVIGFTDIDGKGISGLELALNDQLLLQGDKVSVPRDGRGTPSYLERDYVKSGDSEPVGVSLTLDRTVQFVLEEELEQAMKDTGGKEAMGIVVDPYTGEIFGMAQKPSFDPNTPSDFPKTAFANRLLSHLYEPGSIAKVFFAAEAIQQGLMTPNTLIDCENGRMSFGNKTIKEAEPDHNFGILPLEKVIRYSSNIGAVKIVQALGTDRTRSTIDKFGWTQKTGIRLPAEAASPAKGESFWLPIFLATVGFGQGISVTPLQMVMAFAPFANGGYTVRPRILMEEVTHTQNFELRRVLSPRTVELMKRILVQVTEGEKGTALLAKIPGVKVAGKTGTAQKYEAGVGYQSQKYFSSFVGFLPADKPQLLVGVMVDEPKWPYYASQTAAPLFRRVAERSLQILDRVPREIAQQKPDKTVESPRRNLAAATPKPTKPQPARMTLSAEGEWIMPELMGKGMRETLQIMGKYSDNLKLLGSGFLTHQTPPSGTPVNKNTPVTLLFDSTSVGP